MNDNNTTCYIYPDSPATPGVVTPDVTFDLGIDMNIPVKMDDGKKITMWGFTNDGSMNGGTFPSAPMRINAGTIVHTRLTVDGNMWNHTVHHHGIEPADHADGVGHITWDVDGTYTYQWRPMHAGTYFYHCHTNTVLHAEMGMYGALIVDPPEGPGTLVSPTASSSAITYDVESFWVVDEIDSRWHTLEWDAGTCGEDVGLHLLEPDYFVITGVDGSGTSAMNVASISATVKIGEKLLARYVCAGYHPQHIKFGGLTGTVYLSDGRELPNPIQVTELKAVSAERYDVIFEPTEVGEFIVTCDILDWITGNVLGTIKTNIIVTA
ncbi:multicopper oxidase domain-containing protein [Sulfurimonas sp. SAG-AH-194-C21]|nr:multicopper oxidase domain-containing protein [Sulfurimonas sp. SAG-AH-194-C21]MDF1884264.1 multicopper oxidase domain-containing protein [Sulfurimonas sp. SAG-AH-194-C21]